ncbi:MAG TPA: hypothetical protein DD725_11450 [Deltaproteobacteria bacterium]|nr:hypothetical protein [Deltaproteobacteria bacterium]
MSNRVFLLGAGFSKAAGFPLADGLVSFIQDYLSTSRNTDDIDFNQEFADVLKENPSFLKDNVELFLTYIDLALLNRSVGIFTRFASPHDLRLFRMKLSRAIVRAFDNAHFQLVERFSNKELYSKFCEQLQDGDSVITFNYDLIVEQELWRQRKWTYLDGYGLGKCINDFKAQWGGTYPSDLPTKSMINVYKLHGSLGWAYDDPSEQFFFKGMSDYFDGRLLYGEKSLSPNVSAQLDGGTALIEPSYIKLFNRKPLLDIWEKAFKVLQQSDELIVIGYSLPEADSAARAFLAGGVRSSQMTSITVVDREKSVFEKYEMAFGKKIVNEPQTFEEWILARTV